MWQKLLAFIDSLRRDPPPVVAVIKLNGVIGPSERLKSAINLDNVSKLIATAFTLRGVKAVALSINSPGGSPVQSALIMQRVRDMAREKDIPVLCFCEDVAASGGYMLALAGDEIFAHEASIVGSIGVIYSSFGFPKALEKLGVERRLYTAGESKALLDPFSPEKKEDIERLKELQSQMHEFFKTIVRNRRGRRLKGVRTKVFSGDVWIAKEAEKLGLVDGIGELRATLRDRFGERVKIRYINPPKPRFGGLLGLLRPSNSSVSSIEDLRPINWADDLLDSVELRAMWSRWGL